MINLKNINKEYLISTGFGFLGLILSLLAGIFSGNKLFIIFIRAITTVILFSILGYVCLFIIKKFVPEIYQIINSINNNEGSDVSIETSSDIIDEQGKNDNIENQDLVDLEAGGASITGATLAVNREDAKLEREFNDVGKQPDDFSSINEDEKVSGINSHGVFKDNKIKYEPKIAAQAIRTMMKRDE
jgi:hypothetical protein